MIPDTYGVRTEIRIESEGRYIEVVALGDGRIRLETGEIRNGLTGLYVANESDLAQLALLTDHAYCWMPHLHVEALHLLGNMAVLGEIACAADLADDIMGFTDLDDQAP